MFVDEEMEHAYAQTGKLSEVTTILLKTLPKDLNAEHIRHADHLWRHFASHHSELNPNYFKNYLLCAVPEYKNVINKILSRKV